MALLYGRRGKTIKAFRCIYQRWFSMIEIRTRWEGFSPEANRETERERHAHTQRDKQKESPGIVTVLYHARSIACCLSLRVLCLASRSSTKSRGGSDGG